MSWATFQRRISHRQAHIDENLYGPPWWHRRWWHSIGSSSTVIVQKGSTSVLFDNRLFYLDTSGDFRWKGFSASWDTTSGANVGLSLPRPIYGWKIDFAPHTETSTSGLKTPFDFIESLGVEFAANYYRKREIIARVNSRIWYSFKKRELVFTLELILTKW